MKGVMVVFVVCIAIVISSVFGRLRELREEVKNSD